MFNIKFKIIPTLELMRFFKPIGALLLLWPTCWALWLAGNGKPDSNIIIIFLLGVYVMRAAGCVINDYADYKFDKHVQRTKQRPLATGALSPTYALILFIMLIIVALTLLLYLSLKTQILAVFGLCLAILYPYCKRFLPLPQATLGLSFSWGILMAYMEITQAIPLEAILLFVSNLLWVIAYDTQYALLDIEDDIKLGLRSSAIFFGNYSKIIIASLQLSMLFFLIVIWLISEMTWHFGISLVGVLMCFSYQYRLCADSSKPNIFKAFLNNNICGMLIFIGIVLGSAS